MSDSARGRGRRQAPLARSQGGHVMYTGSSCSSGAPPAEGLFTTKGPTRDDESRLAATLRTTLGFADPTVVSRRRGEATLASPRGAANAQARRVVAEIVRAVDARLPGRISGLKVEVQHDQFVLQGVSSSYYVKQVAGHLAMTTMDARLLGRLVNEIEVRSAR